jgi:hypothetical protein
MSNLPGGQAVQKVKLHHSVSYESASKLWFNEELLREELARLEKNNREEELRKVFSQIQGPLII